MAIKEGMYAAPQGALHYIEAGNSGPALVLIHAQGVNAASYKAVLRPLSKKYHVFAVDCFGHGKSSHDAAAYTLSAMGEAVTAFIRDVAGGKASLVGHSSGGLIAAYVAGQGVCDTLYLEDPPFFSSQGERRYQAYNYQDLSSVCHAFLQQEEEKDFVLYYFIHQKMWDLFPPDAKAKLYDKMVALARKDRAKHPQGDLSLPFWPKAGLAAFQGMSDYDPRFGEAFYTDSFHAGLPHEALLKAVSCPSILMKAKTNFAPDGTLLAAMSEEDAERVCALIPHCRMERFDCGHGVHMEKRKDFLRLLLL